MSVTSGRLLNACVPSSWISIDRGKWGSVVVLGSGQFLLFYLFLISYSMGHRHQLYPPTSMAILHDACNELIDDPRLVHYKSFMIHIYYPLMDELPEFKDYMYYQ